MAIHWWEPPVLELQAASTQTPLPTRIYDSRQPDPINGAGPLAGGAIRNIFFGIWPPHTRVGVGAALTVTIVNTVGAGYLTVYPTDLPATPGVSTINWSGPGQVLATGIVTRLGAAPSAVEPAFESWLAVACAGGSTDFVIDLTAWWWLSTA
jgi:hypothetical protein